MSVSTRNEKIAEIAEMTTDLWHDSDKEGCSLTEKMRGKLEARVEDLGRGYVQKMKGKIIGKLESNVEKIVAKQAAKLAAKAESKSAWGEGTAWHACSVAWCLAIRGNCTCSIYN